jgi:prenylcysteine oxidase / farnesylcysteine lyase
MDSLLAGSAIWFRQGSLSFRSYVEPTKPSTPTSPRPSNLGLTAGRKQLAESYLSANGISTDFSREVVQATARAWFAHDLNDLNGLAALVAMNPADDNFLQPMIGGNHQLIDRLLKLSGAQMHLNTRVTKINRSNRGKYHLTVRAEGLPNRSSNFEAEDYDATISSRSRA